MLAVSYQIYQYKSAAPRLPAQTCAVCLQEYRKQSSTPQQINSSSAQPVFSDNPSSGIICKRLFGAKA